MNYKHTFRGNVLGNDDSYVAGAERFAFDLTPRTWEKLIDMRHALLAGNIDYGLDLCSVTTLSSELLCDIYAERRDNKCRQVECLELVVMPECFYWQFNLGDKTVYQTEEILFKDTERLVKKWEAADAGL